MKGKFIKLLLALIAVLLLTFASGCGSEKETAGSGTG